MASRAEPEPEPETETEQRSSTSSRRKQATPPLLIRSPPINKGR